MDIPRLMSTQHPDNVTTPFFAKDYILRGEDEVLEAYYSYSHLGIGEQMWDIEGKEVDNFVVEKLLTKFPHFFQQSKLGRDSRLTLRVPNPDVEKTEAKILLEALESISRNYDIARAFYEDNIPPIFEVILPMTASAASLNRVYCYYRDFVAGKGDKRFFEGDIRISDWIGELKPDTINVIPLIEDKKGMLNAHHIVEEYLKDKQIDCQRVFLARSDPAMNYGLVSAVLLNKIALQNLWKLAERISVEIPPIIGVGSAPFRGNFKPTNIHNCLWEYPSVQTFTAQSAFKYDFAPGEVARAIEEINARKRSHPRYIGIDRSLDIIDRYSAQYSKEIKLLAPRINKLAGYVPSRRKRKLHIGLFGYSRSIDDVSLPRAITFCAALYSIGLPPEILGLSALRKKDIEYFDDVYVNFREDLRDSLRFFNPDVLEIVPTYLKDQIQTSLKMDYETDEAHRQITSRIIHDLQRDKLQNLEKDILEAAWHRKFLG
ncbi:MAG: phosphoenolpyruvate carboxylase [Desulfurivibrionaceae bacterium]